MNKHAFDVVNETFEKIAEFSMEDLIPAETLKKMKEMASKSNGAAPKAKFDIPKVNNGTHFNGNLKHVKPNSPTMEQVKELHSKIGDITEVVSKKGKLSPKTKTAIGAGIAAASLVGGATAYNKLKKKKEEKTAFDIVNETFEKIAGK